MQPVSDRLVALPSPDQSQRFIFAIRELREYLILLAPFRSGIALTKESECETYFVFLYNLI